MKYECSCGAVLYRKNNDGYEYLIIKDRNNNWSFPKGHVEIDEAGEDCAKREIYEEVGLNVELDEDFCKKISYPLDKNTTKCVDYYMADFKDKRPYINDGEAQEIRILNYEEAYKLITYNQLKVVLQDVHARLTSCCMFSIRKPEEALKHARQELEFVENYGSSLRYHTCDEGERWLTRCKKCGRYVIIQESEATYTDHLYMDYIPTESLEHARYVNDKYNGYEIETKYPYKKLFINDGRAVWH